MEGIAWPVTSETSARVDSSCERRNAMCASDIDRVKLSWTSAIWRWLSWKAATQGFGP